MPADNNHAGFRGTLFKADHELEATLARKAAQADPWGTLDSLLVRLGSLVTATFSEKTTAAKAPATQARPAPAPKASRVYKSAGWTFTRLKD